MASQHTSKVKVLRLVAPFIAILAVIALVTVVVTPAALTQVPQANQRHAAPAKSRSQGALFNSAGSSLFLPAVTYDQGGVNALAVAVADVNGDGKPDLIVANECAKPACGTSSVGVLLGNGDGTFQPVVIYGSVGQYVDALAVADLNGDGKPDVVVVNYLSSSVQVMLGNGDGTFQPAVTYDSGGIWGLSVAIADVNGDGKPDLIVGNAAGPNVSDLAVSVLLGNGDGTFQPAVAYDSGGSTVSSIAVADVNGDGKPDLVVVAQCGGGNCANPGTINVLLGNGDGTFQRPVPYGSGGQVPRSVAVADVNGDGKPDLVIANPSTVGVLMGNGDGTFKPAVTYDSGGGPVSIAVADVNGDGKPDVVVAIECGDSNCDGLVGVLLGNGDGSFQAAVTFASGGYYASWAAVADVNGDGEPDLIVANQSYALGVLLNNSVPPKATTTTLTSTRNPSVYGQAVTFTAKVKSTSGTPAGTVQILNGAAVVGSGTLTNGSASIAVSTLPAGSDSIAASYLGGSGYAASKSAPLAQTVTVATTTTSLASSLNPAATSQSVTFTATVTSQHGGAATGSVVFNSGAQTLGTAPLSGNVAALTVSFSVPGTYSISAKYSGDGNNTGSTSAPLSEKILAATTTILTSSLNPSFIGQAVTFTATVTLTTGTPPNGETITFSNGTAVLGTAPLSGGTAALTTSSLPAGIFTITASYPGDSGFAASTSPGLRQVVNSTTKSATATTFSSSLNPSTYGQKITFTAKVTTAGALPPTGHVAFTWGGIYSIGSATLNSSGVASFSRANLNADAYPLTAAYSGDANNLSSTSPVVNQLVLETTSAAAITASPNPSAVGQAVTFSAKITSPTVTPSGPVTFTAGKTVLGTAQLSGGEATFTTSTLPAGSTVVTLTYNGDSNIAKSTASVTQLVNQ